ncbi:DUF368 domain-containing protein [Lewinella cohaerens]|uniref:DUF368 domain-containing protein n=1 Tax=Lewinella cohaerens TaxID=70995 RepID=UPI00037BB115|nr:DUF368 domain-containing protein [Lewinella cohaerens]
MQKSLAHLALILKGAAMGIAETIPGVSGGTIAFITGIYERLLESIGSFLPAIQLWRTEGLTAFWKKIDGNFLLRLFAGMLLGILLGVFGMSYLLDNFPLPVWGFFFGLIAASAIYIGRKVEGWSLPTILILLLTAALAYWVTIATPAQGSDSLLYVFLCGVIAISALMLPGLSGSFMLLLLGMYQFILHRTLKEGVLEQHDLGAVVTLGAFGLGCVVGVLTFARVLSWLFEHHRDLTMAGLTGFMLGSLNKVWPWQEVLETRINSKGEEQVLFSNSVSPSSFGQLTDNFFYGNDAQLLPVIVLMLIGFVTIFIVEKAGASNPSAS